MLSMIDLGRTILNKLFPDKNERQKYELRLLELQNEGAFKEEELRYAAIMAEAKSDDKITSRARPTFLYVMYVIILSSIPMGILYSTDQQLAIEISQGFKVWLDSIPSDLWMLFGAGYLGYGAYRSYDKKIATSTHPH